MLTLVLDALGRALTRDRCVVCDVSFDTGACPDCRARLPWLEGGDDLEGVGPIAAAWRYDEPVSSAVRRLKYGDRPDLAARLAALASPVLAPSAACSADCIVPVPLHPRRLAQRGFNQAMLLALAFRAQVAALQRTRVSPRALCRRIDTEQLVGMRRIERRLAVEEAFVVRRASEVARRRVVLVDDVVTTGATVEACASALRRAGASIVGVLALCRTVGIPTPGESV